MTTVHKLQANAVEWREVEGEIVALDLRRQNYLAVNRTGAALWPLLARGAPRSDLVATLVDRFDVEPPQAETDLDNYLEQLRELDLLEQDQAP